jgi:nucleotide sugar dehydrogenase
MSRPEGPSPGDQRDVAIIGCGAIGLPLATALASTGRRVLGVDNDPIKRADLDAGRTDLVDAGLAAGLRAVTADGRLAFAETLERADHARAYIVAVPTPATPDGGFDDGPLMRALAGIARVSRPRDLVCVRSTAPIGTTRALAAAFSGPAAAFAACPDRTVAGDAYAEQFSVPHLVGGLDEDAGARAEALFGALGVVARTPDPETAEAIKLFANVERDVTFALANQFALICEATGVDFAAVRRSGSTRFPRFSLARPGPVGGPCLTKDLGLLLASNGVPGTNADLLKAARALNESLPDRLAAAIEAELAKRSPASRAVAILGLAFKGAPPTADRRGAFAGALIERLRARLPGLDIRSWDPVSGPARGRRTAVDGAAVAVLANDHAALAAGLDGELAPGAVVFDLTGLVGDDAPFYLRRFGDGATARPIGRSVGTAG